MFGCGINQKPKIKNILQRSVYLQKLIDQLEFQSCGEIGILQDQRLIT